MTTKALITAAAAALAALALTAAAAASGPKQLAGFYLGEPSATVEYALGTGKPGDSYQSGKYRYRFVRYGKTTLLYRDERVATIDTSDPSASYRGVQVGDRIPLGECHKLPKGGVGDAPSRTFGPCVRVYRGMRYYPGYFTWVGRTKTLAYTLTVDRGAVTAINLAKK